MIRFRAGHSTGSVCAASAVIWPGHLRYSSPVRGMNHPVLVAFSAIIRPVTTRTVLSSEPATDRSMTFLMNGDSRLSE